MDIRIKGTSCTLTSYRVGGCYVTEIALPESGETIARGISNFSSVQSEKEAIQKAWQQLNGPSLCDFELMVGG